MNIELQYPYALALILLIIVALFVKRQQRANVASIFWPSSLNQQAAELAGQNRVTKLARWLTVAATVLLVVATANPLLMGNQNSDQIEARDLIDRKSVV